jgi:hypothetical protein
MKSQFKTIAAVLVLGMAGYAAYAETVTVSTFYPSPYGSYTTLDLVTLQGVGGNAHIWVQPGAGNIGVGLASPTAPAAKLDVRGGQINAADATGGPTAFIRGAAGGISMGAVGTQAVNIGNSEGTTSVVIDGGNTTISGTLLGPTGPTRMRETAASGGQEGVLQLDCDGTNCYAIAVYS